MFEINIDNPKRKSHKKHIDVYNLKPIKAPKECKHKAFNDFDTGEYICAKCHVILDKIYVNETSKVKNSDMLIWNRDYDKNRWIFDTLEYLRGEHNDCFNDVVWLDILLEIPNPCTWSEVYHCFHKYRLTDYWLCFPSYVDLTPKITGTVLQNVLKYAHIGYTKYRISFMFLFYKFSQMEDEEGARYIPFKGTKIWIKKTDAWWAEVCKSEGWEFIATKMEKIYWNKDHICKSLKFIVEQER